MFYLKIILVFEMIDMNHKNLIGKGGGYIGFIKIFDEAS